ncbi:g8637 [Coccomyxa elongata]
MLRGAAFRLLRSGSAARSIQGAASTSQCTASQRVTLIDSFSENSSHPSSPCSSHGSLAVRWYAAAPNPVDEEEEQRPIGSPRLNQLVDEICKLNLLEVSDLIEVLRKRLNITAPMGGGYSMGMMPAAGAGAAGPAAAAEAPAEEEKTEFDVKLTGFDAAAKIKVIKEVRAMTNLGLKEAKELVEKAPTVVKTGLKKEEAEELQKKLEAVGAKVALE